MLAGFAGGKHPNHPIAARGEGRQVAEEDLVIAQAIGGHQPIGQAPSGVGHPFDPVHNLAIAGQATELGGMQAVTSRPFRPILWKGNGAVAGQGSEGGAALLPAAAGGLVALQNLLKQSAIGGQARFPCHGRHAAQVGAIGAGPGGFRP